MQKSLNIFVTKAIKRDFGAARPGILGVLDNVRPVNIESLRGKGEGSGAAASIDVVAQSGLVAKLGTRGRIKTEARPRCVMHARARASRRERLPVWHSLRSWRPHRSCDRQVAVRLARWRLRSAGGGRCRQLVARFASWRYSRPVPEIASWRLGITSWWVRLPVRGSDCQLAAWITSLRLERCQGTLRRR